MGTDTLMKWKDLFSQSSLFTDVFVWIGWALARGLKTLVDAAETLLDEVYNLIDFTTYAGLDKVFTNSDIRLLLGVLFALAFLGLGVTLIFQGDKEKPKVIQNILIAFLVITALPSLMGMLNNLTLQAKDAIMGTQSSTADRIIADNVVDLIYIDGQGFDNYQVTDGRVSSASGKAVNGFSSEESAKNVQFIDATEKVTDDYKKNLNSPDYFFSILNTNSDGSLEVQELKANRFFGFDFTGWYYRYNIDYVVIYISLLATGIALLFTSFKVAKLIFDLAIHGVLAVLFSASDLTNGQRAKKVLQSIGSIYVILVLAVLMIKFYYLGQSYISANISNGLVKAIILIFFAFAVIDGPNIIEQVLGIDVGLKSGFQTMATMFMASRMVSGVAGAAARTTGKIAGGAAGAMKGGIKSGIENFKTSMAATSTSSAKPGDSDKGGINSSSGGNGDDGTSNLHGDKSPSTDTGGDDGGTNNLNGDKGSPAKEEPTGADKPIDKTDPAAAAGGATADTAMDDVAQGAEAEAQKNDEALNNLNADQAPEQKPIDKEATGDTDKGGKENLEAQHSGQSAAKEKQQPSVGETVASALNPHGIAGSTVQSYRAGKAVGGAVGGAIGRKAAQIKQKIDGKDDLKGNGDK